MKHFIGGLTVGLAAFVSYLAFNAVGGIGADHPNDTGLTQAAAPIAAAEMAPDMMAMADVDAPLPGLSAAPVLDAAEADRLTWEAIKATRDPSAVALYVSQNPNSANFDDAMAFLNELLLPDDTNSVTRGMLTPLAPAGTDTAKDFTQATAAFTSRDMAAVMGLPALYPPLEGLPVEAWEGKVCSDCHNLSVEELCDHSKLFMGASYDLEASNPHPLGVSFKKVLKGWAGDGCP